MARRKTHGARLDRLVRLRSIPDLARAVLPEAGPVATAADLQRRLVQAQAAELAHLADRLAGPGADLLAWTRTRFRLENFKVLARGFAGGLEPDRVRRHLIALPGEEPPEPEPFLRDEDFETFCARLPEGPLRNGAARAGGLYRAHPRSFALEAGLDAGYLAELLDRAGRAPDAEHVLTIVRQEVAMFQMMLVARGWFVYGLEAEALEPFAVRPGALAPLLAAADLDALARAAVGRAIDRLPTGDAAAVDPADLEALAWDRYWRLANWTFRRSHMGMGAVVAYTAIRRVELANLIRVSEGIRLGVAAEAIRRLLIPREEA